MPLRKEGSSTCPRLGGNLDWKVGRKLEFEPLALKARPRLARENGKRSLLRKYRKALWTLSDPSIFRVLSVYTHYPEWFQADYRGGSTLVRERQGVRFGDERLSAGETALVIFDMLECYRSPIEEAGTLPNVVKLAGACRSSGLPVFFARADHRADGRDFALTMADTDSHFVPWGPDNPPPTTPPHGAGSPMLLPLKELGMSEKDFDIPKHRWSAFAGTALDITLRALGVNTILLVGGSTHVGVASTAYAARDLDYQVTVVRDGCHGFREQREFFLDHVFPRMCRVRTTAQVITSIVP